MSSKSLLTAILAIALVPAAMAAGSPSTSRPPAAPKAQPSDYELGVKAVQATISSAPCPCSRR